MVVLVGVPNTAPIFELGSNKGSYTQFIFTFLGQREKLRWRKARVELAFLHTAEIWGDQFSLLSMITPRLQFRGQCCGCGNHRVWVFVCL